MTLKTRKTFYSFRGAVLSSGLDKLPPAFPWLGLASALWGPGRSPLWQPIKQARLLQVQ
jgi:hypothetical protein